MRAPSCAPRVLQTPAGRVTAWALVALLTCLPAPGAGLQGLAGAPEAASGAAPGAALTPASGAVLAAPGAGPTAAVARPHPAGRARICLVLSGGGARGAAHVGVLKVLDALHVPVDCVVGTSMGAIVGAAWASGRTAAELEADIATLSLTDLLADDVPRADRSFDQKANDTLPYIGPEFGISLADGLTLPKGAVSGTAIEAVLRRLVRGGQGRKDFDTLPTPLRVVATDVVSGRMVVFDSGNLAQVMRASMSVPGVMPPLEIDGTLLADGGLVRNLPVDVARAMGADVIIAVNLGTPLMKRERLVSALDVSAQMINILTEQNVQRSLQEIRPADVLIEPQLGDTSSADFSAMKQLVPKGEAAAWLQGERLRALALPPAAWTAWQDGRDARVPARRQARAPLAAIHVVGTQHVNPAVIEAALTTKVGEPLDIARLEADLRRLDGWGDFERLGYTIDATPPDAQGRTQPVLTLQVQEKPWGPDYLRFGLGLQSELGGSSSFNLLLSLRRTWLNALGGEWRSQLQMGNVARLETEWLQPLDVLQHWFIAPRVRATREPLDDYQGDVHVASFDVETRALDLDAGWRSGNTLELRLGVERGRRRYTREVGATSLPASANVEVGNLHLGLDYDTLDQYPFPTSGTRLSASVARSTPALGADAAYQRWSLEARKALSLREHTLNLVVSAGGHFGDQPLPVSEYFRLGGPLHLTGYPQGRFAGPSYGEVSLVYAGRFLQTPLLRGAYAGFSLEAARIGAGELSTDSGRTLQSAGLFTGLDSPMGPLYFGMGLAPGGHRTAYIWLGPPQ